MQVAFSGQLSAEDWGRTNTLHFKPSGISLLLRLYLLACFICLIVYGPIMFNGSPGTEFLAGFMGGFVLFYVFLALVISHPFWVGYWARLMYHMNKSLFARVSGQVTDEGVVVCTANSKSEIKWALYKKFKQTKNLYLLYQNKNCFNYFPRGFFATEQDWLAFGELVKNKVPSN